MRFAVVIFILAGLIQVAFYYWSLQIEGGVWHRRSRFLVWFGKGMVVPIALWLFFNLGPSPRFPPMLARLALAKSGGGNWLSAWLDTALPVALVVGSCWVSVTLGWLIALIYIHTEGRREIIHASIFWGVLLSPVVALILYICGWLGVGFAALAWFWPVMRDVLMQGMPRRIPPFYAHALAKMNDGKYTEAESEVIRQLEKCEDDFEGWMMLAELYARHFHDLAEAGRTIHQLCNQSSTTRKQISTALHRLADWQLELGHDCAAAGRTLEIICQEFPATHLADVARKRINELTGASGKPPEPD